MNTSLTYAGAGVDYNSLDPFKRACQAAARRTAVSLLHHGMEEVDWSRGESAYLMRTANGSIIAHVEEGLGTKNLIADAISSWTGKSHYDTCAKDTVAMIVNDMITLGVLPLSVAMHLAVGSSDWFSNEARANDLIRGWAAACKESMCVWSGGETPTLKGVITSEASLLSGSAVGFVFDENQLLSPDLIDEGDAIVFVESSGIHANGLTLARKIADELPNGYASLLPDGTSYGETLLRPTHIYVPLMHECIEDALRMKYAVNITGHGWRKLMRAEGAFEYVITTMPYKQPIFDYIALHGPVDEREMYSNYNMGVGFAIYVEQEDAERVVEIAKGYDLVAFQAGYIRKSDKKRVIIEPKGITFESDTLKVR